MSIKELRCQGRLAPESVAPIEAPPAARSGPRSESIHLGLADRRPGLDIATRALMRGVDPPQEGGRRSASAAPRISANLLPQAPRDYVIGHSARWTRRHRPGDPNRGVSAR